MIELILNDKVYIGRYNDNQELVIPLLNEDDIIFFKNWEHKHILVKRKSDYVKDITIRKVNEVGILCNCFPILNLNEDEVKIVYDFYVNKTAIDCDDKDVIYNFVSAHEVAISSKNTDAKFTRYGNSVARYAIEEILSVLDETNKEKVIELMKSK